MVYCSRCGNMVDETREQFCNKCGAQVTAPQPNYNYQGTQQNYNYQSAQPNYNYQTAQPNYNYQAQDQFQGATYSQPTAPLTPELPMKWYKFLIYFSLFAGAVLNFINGIAAITGSHYSAAGGDVEAIYEFYGEGLKYADIFFGIACICLAVFAIVVRDRLVKFKASGIKSYFSYLVISMGISLIYYAVASSIITSAAPHVSMDMSSSIGSVLGTAIELACTRVYFKKREHLFIH